MRLEEMNSENNKITQDRKQQQQKKKKKRNLTQEDLVIFESRTGLKLGGYNSTLGHYVL